jgi:hypothetical protein
MIKFYEKKYSNKKINTNIQIEKKIIKFKYFIKTIKIIKIILT